MGLLVYTLEYIFNLVEGEFDGISNPHSFVEQPKVDNNKGRMHGLRPDNQRIKSKAAYSCLTSEANCPTMSLALPNNIMVLSL